MRVRAVRLFAAAALVGQVIALSAATIGCYETPQPACAFLCGPDSACPEGYACAADGWCKREGVAPDFACDPTRPDAAPTVDATGAPDAMP